MLDTADIPKLMNAWDVARALRLGSQTSVYKAAERGQIPAPIKIGAKRLWPSGVVEEFVRTGRFNRPAEAVTA